MGVGLVGIGVRPLGVALDARVSRVEELSPGTAKASPSQDPGFPVHQGTGAAWGSERWMERVRWHEATWRSINHVDEHCHTLGAFKCAPWATLQVVNRNILRRMLEITVIKFDLL